MYERESGVFSCFFKSTTKNTTLFVFVRQYFVVYEGVFSCNMRYQFLAGRGSALTTCEMQEKESFIFSTFNQQILHTRQRNVLFKTLT